MHNRVIVVIPTYNEAGNVLPVTVALAKVFRTIPNYDMHILFVDDNSPDGTSAAVAKLTKKYPFVHILHNKRKGGLGHAYKKGFAYAIDKYRADILFEFDADLQHDPAIIPAMLASLADGSDIILGSRYISGGGIPKTWGLHRKFLSVIGNRFIQVVMLNFKIHDWTTGYRAIKRGVVESISPSLTNAAFHGYTWQIGFLVKSLQNKYKVSEVAFKFKDREKGKSKLGPEYIINTMIYIMKVRFSSIIHSRVFKFLMVGGFGSLIQLVALHIFRRVFTESLGPITPYQIALVLAIETAIISNFTWSNLWTFRDRRLKASQIPLKFLQFNAASGGSLLIQFLLASLGERYIGLFTIFASRIGNFAFSLDTGLVFAVVGILVGMFWNFFAYSHLVWKKSK